MKHHHPPCTLLRLRKLDIDQTKTDLFSNSQNMSRTCPNQDSSSHKGNSAVKTSPYGYDKTKEGNRRRYPYQVCRTTFSSTSGTPYYHIQHSRSKFHQVASMRVDGVDISAKSTVQSVAWNPFHRCLDKAGKSCRQFNRNNTRDVDIREIQTAEIRTFTGNKRRAS